MLGKKTVCPRLLACGSLLLTILFAAGGFLRLPEGAAAAQPFETRCGWFINPTPANIWLADRDGQWIIGVQGGYQVEEDWEWPKFKPRQWVKTNGNYGYGCACLELRVDRETHRVSEIKSSRARPLATCRQDRALRKWKDSLE